MAEISFGYKFTIVYDGGLPPKLNFLIKWENWVWREYEMYISNYISLKELMSWQSYYHVDEANLILAVRLRGFEAS